MRFFIPTRRERRLAVAKMQGGFFCYYCDDYDAHSLAIDHVVPRRHNGSDDLRNLVLACNNCNTLKMDYDASQLVALGHETFAEKVAGIQALRADWGEAEVKAALRQPVAGIDPGYDKYEKFLTETPTAKVINAALTYAGLSVEGLRRKAKFSGWTVDRLRKEASKGTLHTWHRIARATGYPLTEFLKIYRGWTSRANTPQRELEYAAACVNLHPTNLGVSLGINSIHGILKGTMMLKCDASLLADTLQIPEADGAALLNRINQSLPKPHGKWHSPSCTVSRELETLFVKSGIPFHQIATTLECDISRLLSGEVLATFSPQRLASILAIPRAECEALIKRINARMHAPRPRPRPRPLPLPLPRPRPLFWNEMLDTFGATLLQGATDTAIEQMLGLSKAAWSNIRTLAYIPKPALFRQICEASDACAGEVLLALERELCAAFGVTVPSQFANMHCLAQLLYLAEGCTTSSAGFGAYRRYGHLPAKHVAIFQAILGLAESDILSAFEKTLWIHENTAKKTHPSRASSRV